VLTVAKTTTCPGTYPGTVTFTVKVTTSGSGNTVAAATTLIYAGGA
jgi:hypothetical protein